MNDQSKLWPRVWLFIFTSIRRKCHHSIHDQNDKQNGQSKRFLESCKDSKHQMRINKKNHYSKYTRIVFKYHIQNILIKFMIKNEASCFKKMNVWKQRIAYEIDTNNTRSFTYWTVWRTKYVNSIQSKFLLIKFGKFVQNCNSYEWNKSWYDWKQNLLCLLFVSDRTWQELSVDFIVNLLKNDDYTNFIIIINKLKNNMIFEFMKQIYIENIIWVFVWMTFQ